MSRHGNIRTQLFRFSGGKTAIKDFYFCGRCQMEVDEFQWKSVHAAHAGPDEPQSAAIGIPATSDNLFEHQREILNSVQELPEPLTVKVTTAGGMR